MSSIPRIFSPNPTINWPVVTLDGDTVHHLKDVLRIRPGNRIEIVAGDTIWTVTLSEFTSKTQLLAEVIDSIPASVLPVQIHLIQCLPKVDKLSDIIRTCTELGVNRITPVISDRCVSVPNEKSAAKHVRWMQIAASAAAQSRQSRIPQIDSVSRYETTVSEAVADSKIIFWEDSETPLRQIIDPLGLTPHIQPRSLCIVIGPEGGLTPTEVQRAQTCGFQVASLGPTILRVEHAGVVAMAQLMYALQ